MEKVLILNGSPRGKKGNTAKLIDQFMKGYQTVKPNSHIDYVELRKKNVKNCIGCFNCWTKTPGKCIHGDDMETLLQQYIDANVVIWATPLYHHGMTSILKTFVERTLPISEPYIIKKEGKFAHPERYETSGKRNILISNCGFPEHHNFDIMMQSFKRITNNHIDESILCIMGELLSKKPLAGRIQWYMEALETAGKEYAQNRHFDSDTRNTLGQPLVPLEDFIEMANLSWEAEGEIPPNFNEAMGEEAPGGIQHKKGFSYLKLMRQSFISKNAKGLDAILEIEFTDLNETHHFIIKNQKCELIDGRNTSFTTKIITTYDTWMKISNGEVSGSQAMMDGLYRIEGDFNFMMVMSKIFGSGESDKDKKMDECSQNSKILGIKGEKWMSISFIPWILSWICIGFNSILGVWSPLLLSGGIAAIKRKNGEVTYFEKMSVLYFSVLGVLQLLGISFISTEGTLLNYFSMALIWGISLLDRKPLTADYSKHRFDVNMQDNIMFTKTNEILTLFWSTMFILQGCLFILLRQLHLVKFTPFLYILTFIALKFTGWFSNWYPGYIAKGRVR
ncbi:NAD(P)H-dependent oxidoreductase [Lutibacter sp. B2]|nr:NAD(P)H-dependent oxidoreductase [Lutibacter sp. B2]